MQSPRVGAERFGRRVLAPGPLSAPRNRGDLYRGDLRRTTVWQTLEPAVGPGRPARSTTAALQLSRAIGVKRRQISHLMLGDVELDHGAEPSDGADRDGHLFGPPQMPLVEQQVGHLAITRVNGNPPDSTDVAVSGMDRPPGVHGHFSRWNAVVNEGLTDAVPVRSRRKLRLLGRIEFFELRLRAAETNLARRDVDKVDRHKSAESLPMPWFDHKMSDPLEAVDDHTAHLATGTIGAAGIDPDREPRHLCHNHPSSASILRSTRIVPRP